MEIGKFSWVFIFFSAFSQSNEMINIFHCEYGNQSVDFYLDQHRGLYTHKKNGILDFSFPNSNGGDLNNFKFETYPNVGGAETKISFKNKNYTYVIYETSRRNMSEYEYDSGYYVMVNGSTGVKKSCTNEDASIRKEAYDILHRK